MSNVIDNVLTKKGYHFAMDTVSRVKLADVASLAGVSVATVSKVVNGRYGVARATMDRVQQAIDELGYAGNLSASSLRSSRTNVLGILVADFEPFSSELLKGVAAGAHGSGYELLAYSGAGDASGWERRSLARLGGTLIDGAILVTPTTHDARPSVPVVAVDPHYGPTELPTVDADSYGGAVMATEHLLGLGHRRIAMLGGRVELDSARLREAGFRDAMAAAGVPVDESLVRETRFNPEIAEQVATEILTLPEPPSALFAANDITAERAMRVARRLGLRLPEDLSVIGFDDIPEASHYDPPLTTVRQPLQRMGEEAMTLLLDLMAGRERDLHVRLPVELVVRASCVPHHD